MMSRDWHPKRPAHTVAALVVLGALFALSHTPLAAQRPSNADCEVLPGGTRDVWRVDGEAPPDYCRTPDSHFSLFGAGDFAGTGMRLADPNLYAFVTNSGFMDTGDPGTVRCCTLPMATCGTVASPSTCSIYQYFEVQFYEAIARGDWVRNRELAPSLQNVQGGGWTVIANTGRTGGIPMFQGGDGSTGLLHSGALSARGGGCREHGGNFLGYPDGFPLLAGSDCPETWGATGWQGRRPVNYQEGWLNEFQAKGDEFAFEFWRVDDEESYVPATEKEFIGDFQTYGVMSDHGLEHRARYGDVVPSGSGTTTLQGYPPGLTWYFNAFSFKIPTVAGMYIYEGLIVNESEQLYGVPLDYDSIYVGVQARWLRGGSGRRATVHNLPEMGAIISNELARTPDCDGGDPVPTSIGCPSGRSTEGFNGGASGFVFLKSPIGDLRYKHFTRLKDGSPCQPGVDAFCNPGHPLAGDTITFNRSSMCGFECTNTQISSLQMRRAWGTIAAEPLDALDGRDPTLVSEREYWMIFKPEAGVDTRLDPADPRGPGGFNYYVPGDWTYTNRPSGAGTGPDTLWFDNCSPTRNDCTALWSDTLPDHTLNWAYNASWLGVGPFPLAAGDTTPFVIAAFAAVDSARFMSLLENIYNFYVYDFYLGPGVPVTPSIVSTTVEPGARGRGETNITMLLGDEASKWRDPFALKFVETVREAAPGTDLGRLKALNPTLVEDLEAEVNSNNVDRVFVFKSCNNGDSFTATASGDRCPADRAIDEFGNVVGTGWEAYATLLPDERGVFPSSFEDASVTSGRSYLYSLVAETDGIDLVVDDSVDTDGDGFFDRVESVTLSELGIIVLPASRSALLTNVAEPGVVSVYVPASNQAGAVAARAEVTLERGPVSTSTGLISLGITGEVDTGASYSLVFGDSVHLMDYFAADGAIDSTVVVLYRAARTGFDAGGDPIIVSFAQDTFRSTSPDGVVLAADAGDVEIDETPDVRTQRVTATAGMVAEAAGSPLFVSAILTGSAFTPPDLFSRPEFGGFVVSATNSPAAKLDEFWALDGVELRSASWPTLEWLDGDSDATGDQYGVLDFAWAGGAFASTVQIDQLNPGNTASAYASAVTGRTNTSSTVTDQATVDLIAEAMGMAPEDVVLASVSLPFTVTNSSANAGEGRAVDVAILEEDLMSEVLLGISPDTLTVDVPANSWIPGVRLILIEDVEVAQTDGGGNVVTDSDGEPQITTTPRVTWTSAVLGCANRTTCNPVTGPGQDGYVTIRNGMSLAVDYANGLTGESRYEFNVVPPVRGTDIDPLSGDALDAVRVVPNPYIFYSTFEQQSGQRRLMFTNLPPEGRIRIYTVSGQFVQEMNWGPEDLMGNGDLFYNLRTVEDNEMSAGVYLYLVEATGSTGGNAKKLGKFIIIR